MIWYLSVAIFFLLLRDNVLKAISLRRSYDTSVAKAHGVDIDAYTDGPVNPKLRWLTWPVVSKLYLMAIVAQLPLMVACGYSLFFLSLRTGLIFLAITFIVAYFRESLMWLMKSSIAERID